MIVLQNLTKIYSMRGIRKTVLNNVNAVFPSRVAVGLLGRNGAGKSTLLSMIAGKTDATSGQILSDGTISFPVGFAGSFHPDMTGAQNIRFVARIYNVDTEELMDFVRDFAELGGISTCRCDPIHRGCGRGWRSACRWGCALTPI